MNILSYFVERAKLDPRTLLNSQIGNP
jgi:hypothetical protein